MVTRMVDWWESLLAENLVVSTAYKQVFCLAALSEYLSVAAQGFLKVVNSANDMVASLASHLVHR